MLLHAVTLYLRLANWYPWFRKSRKLYWNNKELSIKSQRI